MMKAMLSGQQGVGGVRGLVVTLCCPWLFNKMGIRRSSAN